VVTGGDLIMDSFGQPRERTKTQWDLYTNALKDHCGVPVEHCLGNHDIWGWDKKKSKTTGEEAEWGKKWACDLLGLPAPYRAFTKAGWRFVVLDSVQPHGDGYLGGLDEAQTSWLEAELAANAAMPTLIVSHVPIVSAVACLGDGEFKEGMFTLTGGNVFMDQKKMHTLLRKNPQVKACISGHIHQVEDLMVEGVRYICDGAVSGSWWQGEKDRCKEGYGLFDLYDDGRVDWRYETYGWKAEA
jgi:3',5'-cyclic-AMP phosphodiesterase